MRRILTKGFTSLWNLMKLQAKPVVATMSRKCLVKSTTGLSTVLNMNTSSIYCWNSLSRPSKLTYSLCNNFALFYYLCQNTVKHKIAKFQAGHNFYTTAELVLFSQK